MVKPDLKAIIASFKPYFLPENEKLLVHSMQFVFLAVLVGFGFATHWMYGTLKHGFVETHDTGHAAAEYDTDQNVGLGESHIPKDILARQDGVPEKNHDLVETYADQGRGLASLIKPGEISVDVGPFYYEFTKVASGLKREDNHIEAIVETDISFEVKDRATKAEMESRRIELKALLETLVAEFSKKELLETRGKYELKKHLMSQINFRLKNGQVSDVLISNFRIQ